MAWGSDEDEHLPILQTRRSSAERRVGHGKAVLRLIGASVALLGVVLSWVLMAELLQKLNKHYKKPYFMNWIVRSSFAAMYVVWKFWRIFPGNLKCNRAGDGAFPKAKPLLIACAVLSVIGLFGGYFWFLSLPRTNIPANNAIYQATPAFVFIVSVPLLREKVTAMKIVSVVLCVAGVSLVAFYSYEDQCNGGSHQSNSTNHTANQLGHMNPHHPNCTEHSTWLGYVYLLVGVILYGLYEVLYKKYATRPMDSAEVMNSFRFVGYVGVYSLFFLWPPIIVLHYAGKEKFELPSEDVLGQLALNILLEIVFQLSMAACISLSSPLFATVGSVLIVPISVVLDWILQDFELPPLAYLGVVLILLGFAGFVFSQVVALKLEERDKHTSIQAPGEKESTPDGMESIANLSTTSWTRVVLKYLI